MQQEATAIRLQTVWRMRKSRLRLRQLKQQQQQLRDEGAAVALQSAWRRYKLRKQPKNLRLQQKNTLNESSELIRNHLVSSQEKVRDEKRKLVDRSATILNAMKNGNPSQLLEGPAAMSNDETTSQLSDSMDDKNGMKEGQDDEESGERIIRKKKLNKFREGLHSLKDNLAKSRNERINGDDSMTRISELNSPEGFQDEFHWLRARLLEKKISKQSTEECVQFFRENEINDEDTLARIDPEIFSFDFLVNGGIKTVGVIIKLQQIHQEVRLEIFSFMARNIADTIQSMPLQSRTDSATEL